MGRGRNRKFISFDDYVNQRGIERLSNPTVDLQIDYYIRMINQMKQEMFYSFKKGQSKIIKSKIESIIQEHLRNYFKGQQSNVALIRQQTKQKLLQELDSDLKESIQKYFKRFKGVSIIE